MKKLIKLVVGLVVVLVLVIVAAVLALPFWIGPVAKTAVNQIAPAKTKTNVHLGEFALNPYVGSLRIGDFQLWNPEGYSQKMAFTLGHLSIDVDPASVLSDVVHIRSIRIQDVFASYIGSAHLGLGGTNNFKQILANVKGVSAASPAPEAKPAAPAVEEPKQPGYLDTHKVIIDLVEIKGVLVQIGPLSTPVPVPTIRNIGASSGGVTFEAAWAEIWQKFLDSMGSAGATFKDLGKNGLDAGKKGLDTAKQGLDTAKQGLDSAVDAAKKLDVKGAQDAIKDSGEKLKETGKALENAFKSIF